MRVQTKLIDNKFGEYELTVPKEALGELGWKIGDDLLIEECDIYYEDTGEHKGIIISNLTKNEKNSCLLPFLFLY